MANLWDKINVLVRSHVDRFLEEGLGLGQGRSADDLANAARLGKNVEREIAALRKQVDTALEREDSMEAQIAQLRQEMAALDAQADQALLGGDEASARHVVSQIKALDRKATMLEADLDEHRRSTAAFIDQVNEIEALVADAQRRAADPAPAQPPAQDAPPPSPPARLTTEPPAQQAAAPAPPSEKPQTVKIKVQTGEQSKASKPAAQSAPAKPAEAAAPPPKAAEPPAAAPEPVRVTASTPASETLDSILATARREIETLAAEEQRLASQPPPTADKPAEVSPETRAEYESEVEQAQVEDDLALRRARLTRRLSDKDEASG